MLDNIHIILITIVIALVAWIYNTREREVDESFDETKGENKTFITKEVHILKEEALLLKVKNHIDELRSDFKLQTTKDEERWKGIGHSINNMQGHVGLIMEKLGIIHHK